MEQDEFLDEKIYHIFEVLDLLKENVIFYTFDKKRRKTFFVQRNNKIIIQANSYKVKLDIDEFSRLYRNEEFYLFTGDKEVLVDEEKDKEYYSWEHK